MQAILVDSHANTSAAGLMRTVFARSDDLIVVINLVKLEHRELGWLSLVLSLLGLGVSLLLSLLGTTTQAQHQVKGRLLLDVVVGKGATILQLLTSKDQSLLIWGNAFLVLNLLLDIVNRVRWLHLKGDGLARERLHEDLHSSLN